MLSVGARQLVHATFRTHDISFKNETRHFVQKLNPTFRAVYIIQFIIT